MEHSSGVRNTIAFRRLYEIYTEQWDRIRRQGLMFRIACKNCSVRTASADMCGGQVTAPILIRRKLF